MPSIVDVCNKALDKLGQGAITSLDDNSKAASLCSRNWPLVRDEVLRSHPWNFAIKRTTLAPLTDSPEWGYRYAFALPSDYIRLIELDGLSTGEYVVEGGNILADDSVLYIRYVQRVTDPNRYDASIIDAMAARLAMELCEAFTQSNTKKQLFMQEFDESITNAKRVDGQENPPVQYEEDEWVSVRY